MECTVRDTRAVFEEDQDKEISDKRTLLNDKEISNKWTLLNATNAVALLYGTSCLACAVQLERLWGPCTATVWLVAAIFVLLAAFTIREYWHMLVHAVHKWQF
jgi:hypothetical protein